MLKLKIQQQIHYSNVKKVVIRAFTLAEILLALGVIGILTTLIIPALINSTNDLELRTAWKTNYKMLAELGQKINNDYGGFYGLFRNPGCCGDVGPMGNVIRKYLNYNKECSYYSDGGDIRGNCWAQDTRNKKGDIIPKYNNLITDFHKGIFCNGFGYQMANGSFWCFDALGSTDCDVDFGQTGGYSDMCAVVWVDVNGFKGPNQQDKDIFGAFFHASGQVYPIGVPPLPTIKHAGSTTDIWTSCPGTDDRASGCSASIIKD